MEAGGHIGVLIGEHLVEGLIWARLSATQFAVLAPARAFEIVQIKALDALKGALRFLFGGLRRERSEVCLAGGLLADAHEIAVFHGASRLLGRHLGLGQWRGRARLARASASGAFGRWPPH